MCDACFVCIWSIRIVSITTSKELLKFCDINRVCESLIALTLYLEIRIMGRELVEIKKIDLRITDL